jgi:hypothetical protein
MMNLVFISTEFKNGGTKMQKKPMSLMMVERGGIWQVTNPIITLSKIVQFE